ncbi:MAG: protein kinase [Acidobacteria bacterium]|nr:protein kinase [Acidobacteriota bacterium]
MQFPPGYRLGPYEVTGHLGTGGMGTVLRAVDTRLHREVAIKVLHTDLAMPGLRERFLREARAASSLNHPNICTVYDIGEQHGELYMVMELLHGETLKDTLEHGALSTETVIDIARQIADALAAAHSNGIIHRDIKPANIFLVPRPNGTHQGKVLDFGLAKMETAYREHSRLSMGLTTMGATVGTVAYMSPEQAKGETLDARSDLFSLGAVLYEMVTGTVPFHGATSAIVFVELLSNDPPPIRDWNKNIPPELDQVIYRLLEKDRTNRYQNAAELYRVLERLFSRPQISAQTEKPKTPPIEPEEPNVRDRKLPSRQVPSRTSQSSSVSSKRTSLPPRPSIQIEAVEPLSLAHTQKTSSNSSAIPHSRVVTDESAGHIHEETYANNHDSRIRIYTIVIIFIAVLLAIGFLWWRTHASSASIVAATDPIQITTIENLTGDGTLNGISALALELQIAQSPKFNVRGESNFRNALPLNSQPNAMGAAAAREIAQKLGAAIYIYGTLTSVGPQQYKLSVEAIRVDDNRRIATEEEQVIHRQSLLAAIEHIAQHLRADFGEADASIAASNVPLALSATLSLPAFQSLQQARSAWAAGDYVSAGAAYRQALSADPNFNFARIELAFMQLQVGAEPAAKANLQAAAPLLNKGTTAEKFELQALTKLVSGDPAASAEIARQWTEQRPSDAQAYVIFASGLRLSGRFTDAEQPARTALSLNPFSVNAISQAERNMLALNRFESIVQTEERSARFGVHHPGMQLLGAYSLGRINDPSEQHEYIAPIGKHVRDQMHLATYQDNTGQLNAGALTWNAAADALATEPTTASAAISLRQTAALNRAMAGDCAAAHIFLTRSANIGEMSATAIFHRGLAAVTCGDTPTASAMESALQSRFTHEPVAAMYLLPNLSAAIALASGSPDRALALLSTARGPASTTLTPYLRALAHLSLHQYDVALVSFQTVLTNRGVAMLTNTILYPIAQRRLAETYAAMGDKSNASHAYAEFAKTWSHADRNVAPKLR